MAKLLNADRAEEMAAGGERVILVRLETSPEDIHGMHAAAGILTARGGMTSHAAVVARGMGKPCVSGASDVRFDEISGKVFIADHVLGEGDVITIDGTSGEVYDGKVDTTQPKMSDAFATVMRWADQARRMEVRTNAETPTKQGLRWILVRKVLACAGPNICFLMRTGSLPCGR